MMLVGAHPWRHVSRRIITLERFHNIPGDFGSETVPCSICDQKQAVSYHNYRPLHVRFSGPFADRLGRYIPQMRGLQCEPRAGWLRDFLFLFCSS